MKKDFYKDLPLLSLKSLFSKYKKPLKVVIFGNFGAMNMGDEAILAGQIAELKKMKRVSIRVIARYPNEVRNTHGVHAISILAARQIFSAMRNTDVVIIGGGGLICKTDMRLFSSLYQLYCFAFFYALPLVLKKDLYPLGLGVYENAHKTILSLAFFFLRRCKKVTVRDHHSFTLLQKHGIQAVLYKDNSFLMKLSRLSSRRKTTILKKYRSNRLHIGISLRQRDTKAQTQRLIKEVAQFVVAYADRADFWYYSLESYPSWDDDKQVGMKILEKAQQLANGKTIVFEFVPSQLHPKELFSSFQAMDFFISMRLHSSIFCYRMHIPFIGFSYDKKCTSFLESIGKKAILVKDLSRYIITRSLSEKEAYAYFLELQ